jgi:Colicin V production protein.
MNIVDIVVIILLALGAIVGYKKGFTSQLLDTVGLIVIIVLSFLLKGFITGFLYNVMPFFNFYGDFQYITSLNIILYEVVAFVLIFSILSAILALLKATTRIFETMLNFTIILGIPSKILGAVVGLVNNFIFIFVALYFLSLPMLGFTVIRDAAVTDKILGSTPFLSNICSKSLDIFEDIDDLVDEYKDKLDSDQRDEVNQKTLQLLVDKKVIKASTANELISSGKLRYLTPVE